MLLKDIYSNAKVVNSGKTLTTVNEFTDQLPALRPQVLIEVAYKIMSELDGNFDKIITEEDKGAPLATTLSLLTGKPLAMARWYPYSLSEYNNNVVDIKSEYFEGKMYLNGVEEGDRIVIIDDTLSTGGAVISLVEAVENAGGIITKIICAVEKIQNKGRDKVKSKTGHDVTTLIKIHVTENKVSVV
ncbi:MULTISPECIES: phosphoribosyltransferase family protein [Dickeya]|uniref:phosphoribosyltransferase family protein n=1 Tax=Dickeya TaxID=204037 RepID=UPI0003A9CB24|nr:MULTISPECIES: phosphoribosyltransferase family protein [Dickeya]MCI4031735.1 adenine phosphoribosyltransferase [Dickeya dianthicola]MCI4173287.1 adenine phosphoribosyltransferase [Dickeya dianthicola]MCI4179027.1 adenine phosphoribosyltransferase [Dickeya dianthicola]MCI4182343.1 adenine phosphoribosyltransferase [Dickeya dianthicola]MCI4186563.1 adenine phosphoribosyltransferase [Dickeya dianthicola]